MDGKMILLIDDEKDFSELLKIHLEAITDLAIAIAADGKTGIALAKKIKPALIFLDIVMPGMDGYEVLRKLKKDRATVDIPVVMLSAKGDAESKIKAAQLYNEEYITKPVEAHDLKAKIEEILKRRGIA